MLLGRELRGRRSSSGYYLRGGGGFGGCRGGASGALRGANPARQANEEWAADLG